MQMKQHFFLFIVACCLPGVPFSHAQDDLSWASSEKTRFTPNVHHPNIKGVTLFAQNPDIVTPIGIAVASDGRVFVQENHTHKRNSDYEGPETDRILVFEDTDNDGIADDRSVFYEGHTFSTDLLFGPDGHLYVSTRWFIGRFPNASQETKAEGEPEKLIICETEGDYPHNGVGGLAIDPANPEWLAFGFGENLGADYTFVGSDGVKLSGGAEGGATYRCRTDGSRLTRQSTGHWNAFGMAYDLDGNLFSTDNDPNATPPNRLLHIISGADFGFEYRYGRSGQHPLVCWNGENPGTLGMIGALGEAACGLIPHGPGKLLSASWTDNRVDLHSLTAKGESFTATREPFLSGPENFRPVHFAYSADGRYLYFTDWVKLSYPVHGHGRIWRVEFNQPVSLEPSKNRPTTNDLSAKDAFAKLGSSDPYARTAAMHALAEKPDALTKFRWQTETSGIGRAHYAVALKRSDAEARTEIIPALLKDKDSEVRFVGIKWIADEELSGYASNLKAVLDRSDLSRRDLLAVVAALARIDGDSKKEFSPGDTLLELALDTDKSPGLRAMALANVKVDHPRLTVATLAPLTKSKHQNIQREAVHSLVIHADANRAAVLAEIAADDSLDENLRADAIAGLASVAMDQEELLNTLSTDGSRVISEEAIRTRVASGLAERLVETKPKADQIEEWIELINREATEKPDAAVGRRLFFHTKLAGCYKCHAIQGRGNSVGPDLTSIHNQTDVTQEWLLKHIVNPNAEMAPYYRPQQLITVDGKVLVGLIVGKEGKKQGYIATDGTVFYVDKDDVEERREMTTSIMPSGLMDALSANEIRHLLAFLLSSEQRYSKTVASNSRPIPGSVQRKERIHLIADFGDDDILEGKKISHKASVTLVDDVPEGGGKSAVKTVVDPDAGTKQFFGTGFKIPRTDFTKSGEIRFWIKADFESRFNFQCSSGAGKTSVLPFTTVGSVGKWKLISAPVAEFSKPRWAKEAADLKAVHFLQVLAFGNGPYDGKTILLDDVVGVPLSRAETPGRDSMPLQHAATSRQRVTKNISLTKINGRHWLVNADGEPFFAHGITHVGTVRAKFDLKKFSAACKGVGFNSYGYGCPSELRSDMPYLESWNHLVPISMYRGDGTHNYCDIFDPGEQARIERGVKANCEQSKGNPNCIGYAWTDLATWPLKNQIKKSWVDFIRELPEDAPGQKAWQKFLSTWDGPEGNSRDQAFLKLIAREYFRVIGTANRKYDPDHLIFGDRLSFYTYDEDVLKEMLPWIDAIAFQPHFWRSFPKKQFDEMYALSGKPILLCDFAIRFKDGGKDVQMWKMEEDSVAAGRSYAEYLTAALDSEYIIGVFWCNPVDTPKGFHKAGVKQGFFGEGLSERPGLHDAVRKLNRYRDEITPVRVRQ